METSNSKMEAMMKPVLFKAGIPLAVSLAGFIIAKIATRKSDSYFHSLDSECLPLVEDDHASAEEISRLRRQIEDMEDRELQLERRFLHYQGLKDEELVLIELHNKTVLESNRVEFLEREVSLVEAERQRFRIAAEEYLKLLRLCEFLRSENEELCERVKKLLRRTKEHSRILRKQCLMIQCKEKDISRNREELEEKVDEIKELKFIIEQLSDKLRAAEEEVEEEKASKQDYNRVADELQHTDTSFGGIEEFGLDNELDHRALDQDESYFGLGARDQARSRRRKLITKLKRWVEGGEKSKQMRLDVNKCFPRHYGAEDAYLPARKSCSSV